MKKLIIVILLVLILAAVTKPSVEDYHEFIKTELKDNGNDNVFAKLFKEGLNIQSELTTDYQDKIFYSTAQSTISNEKREYIGIFGTWFRNN